MKEYNQEIESYTKLLMKCVLDNDFFDEGLITYLLNYKRDIIEGQNFISRENFGVIKSNLWGYIKNKVKDSDIEKWAILLNKDIKEEVIYHYLKFNFCDKDKRDRRMEYKPLYFKEYGKRDQYVEVSKDFLNIVQIDYSEKKINPEKLTETELKLIMNDLINDNNINVQRLIRKENHEQLIVKIKDYIIENYEEMEKLAKEDKKSLIRIIAMGNEIINEAFQSIQGKEREKFISKYQIEDKVFTYMRYKDINKDYVVNMVTGYKDKEFWIKEFKCYNKKENKFYIKNAIKDFIIIDLRLEEMYETQNHKINDWNNQKLSIPIDTSFYGKKYERILDILKFFKEELKSSANYKQEMEKLMIIAIVEENEYLFKSVKTFMKDENDNQEDMDFKNGIYKEVYNVKKDFLEKMKKREIKEFKERLSVKLEEKGIKNKKMKI